MTTIRFACCSALIASIAGCGLQDLADGERMRPALGDDDCVAIDPACPVLPSSGTGIIVPRRLITLTGLRASGLGAEAVPVRINLGSCAAGAAVVTPAGDAGAAGDRTDDDGAADDAASAPPEAGGSSCGPGFPAVMPGQLARLRLAAVDTTRCISDNGSVLECSLGPDGSITIALEAVTTIEPLQQKSVPLCVSYRKAYGQRPGVCGSGESGEANSDWLHLSLSAAIVPDLLSARVGILADLGEAQGLRSCNPDAGACSAQRAVGSFTVGLVSSDVPLESVVAGSFAPPSGTQTIALQLKPEGPIPAGSRAASLSTSGTCDGASDEDAGVEGAPLDQEVSVEVGGEARSANVTICGDGYGGRYRLIATVKDQPDVSGSRVVELPAQRTGLRFDPPLETSSAPSAVHRLLETRCGAGDLPVQKEELDELVTEQNLVVPEEGDPVQFRRASICPSTAPVDDEDGGAAGPPSPACGARWTASFEDGGRCVVEGGGMAP